MYVCVRIWIGDCHFWTKVLFGSKNYHMVGTSRDSIIALHLIWRKTRMGFLFTIMYLLLCYWFIFLIFFCKYIYIYISLFFVDKSKPLPLSLTGEKRIDKWKYKKLNPCLNIWSFSYCTQVESNLSLSKKWMVSIWVLKKK